MPAKKAAKPAAKKSTKKAAVPGKCGSWKATLNMMPPGPWTLHVTGKCSFPRSGYKVTLKPAASQGINPLIFLLVKTVTPPQVSIPEPQVVNVDYKKKTKTKYQKVTILPDGVTVKVQIVN